MNGVFKSADGARVIQERYLELLARWPVANQHLRLPTREGETIVVACGPEGASSSCHNVEAHARSMHLIALRHPHDLR